MDERGRDCQDGIEEAQAEAHARYVAERLQERVVAKYMAGYRKHGGKLWNQGVLQAITNLEEEAIDSCVYVTTALDLLENLQRYLLDLAEDLEYNRTSEEKTIRQLREILDGTEEAEDNAEQPVAE